MKTSNENASYSGLQLAQNMSFSAGNIISVTEFLKKAVTLSDFELQQCSFHINGVEFDKDLNGDQITPWFCL